MELMASAVSAGALQALTAARNVDQAPLFVDCQVDAALRNEAVNVDQAAFIANLNAGVEVAVYAC